MMAKGDLTQEEIVEAINHGGYPLEVRLRHALSAGGMHPQLGAWMPVSGNSEQRAEIDLIAQFNARASSANLGVYFFIEAKNLGAPGCMVGISDAVMSQENLAHNMMWLHGHLDKLDELQVRMTLAKGLEPLASGAQCVHWTIVRRDKKAVKAESDNRYAESMRAVVRATYWHAMEWREFLKRERIGNDLRAFLPILVVDTEHLYTYSPVTGEFCAVDQFHLLQTWDVGGTPHSGCLTVLAARAINKFILDAESARQAVQIELERVTGTNWSTS
jgi:hypothetical protein